MLNHFAGHFAYGPAQLSENSSNSFQNAIDTLGWAVVTSESGRFRIAGNCIDGGSESHDGASSTGSIIALAGLLLMGESLNGTKSAAGDRRRLANHLTEGDISALESANGTFAAAFYLAKRDELVLCTDSLGARPLYYRHESDGVWFSTSFHLLLKITARPTAVNLAALAEQFAFCYPLRERTAVREISVLRDNECLLARSSGAKTLRYFDWQTLPVLSRDPERELQSCADAFQNAVYSRTTDQTPQLALLSGGLDSRCIVAELRARGIQVTSATIASRGSLDHFYAHEFAKASGVELLDVETQLTPETTPGKRTRRLLKTATAPFRGQQVFSGDGGGETFGFLIMSSEMTALLSQNKVEEALRLYCADSPLPLSILNRETLDAVRAAPYHGMKEEFEEMGGMQPEKAFQLFLLRNDLRRHLHDYFESLDEETCELLLPFYDRRVVASVLQIAPPLKDYIRHAFYYRLLDKLPGPILSVRWQAYPKSLPCPLPGSDPAPDQWQLGKRTFANAEAIWRRESLRSLSAGDCGRRCVRPSRIAGAAMLDFLRLRKYGYLFMSHLAIRDFCRQGDLEDRP